MAKDHPDIMAKDGKSPQDHPDIMAKDGKSPHPDIMAKDGAGIVLTDYIPEEVPGEYDEYVKAMLAADAVIAEEEPDLYAKGKRKQATIVSDSRITTRTVNGKEEEVDLEVEKTVRKFQESARIHDRTAKVVGRQNMGDGKVILRFILTPKQRRPRKPRDESNGTGETATQGTPQEATAAV